MHKAKDILAQKPVRGTSNLCLWQALGGLTKTKDKVVTQSC